MHKKSFNADSYTKTTELTWLNSYVFFRRGKILLSKLCETKAHRTVKIENVWSEYFIQRGNYF